MTNKINNQPAKSFVDTQPGINPGLKQHKIVSPNIRYEVVPQQVQIPVKDEGYREIRRYSFDDNGGGYLGL